MCLRAKWWAQRLLEWFEVVSQSLKMKLSRYIRTFTSAGGCPHGSCLGYCLNSLKSDWRFLLKLLSRLIIRNGYAGSRFEAISVSKQALITLTQKNVLSPREIPDMDLAAIITTWIRWCVFVMRPFKSNFSTLWEREQTRDLKGCLAR